jgi:hypothetical protein
VGELVVTGPIAAGKKSTVAAAVGVMVQEDR